MSPVLGTRCAENESGKAREQEEERSPGECQSVQRLEGAAAFLDEALDGFDVFVGEAFALVFAPEDVAQLGEVFEERDVVVGPGLVAFELCLDAPAATKFLRTDFAPLAFGCGGSPFVDVADAHGFPGECLP